MLQRRAREAWDRSPALRLGAAAAAMLAAGEGAALLLAPSQTGPEPLAVDLADHLDAATLERAADYRSGQRWLLLAGLGCQLAAAGLVATGHPARLRAALERLAGRRWLGPAAAGALVVAVAEAAGLPAGWLAHERAVEFGLSVQSTGSWLADVGRSLGIAAVLGAAGATGLAALVRRFPRGWWLPAAGGATALAATLTLAGPVLIAPQFNDFEPLPEGSELRAEVVELGRRAGVDVGEVYRVDASRRSRTLNAYVAGLGPTKRVVLYDTLVADAKRDELTSVVAHELAHVANADLRRGLAFVAIVAPFGMLFARELAERLAGRAGAPLGTPAGVPALLLAVGVAAFAANVPGNQLSREVERAADAFALELTDDPQGLVGLQERLARTNLSDPDPPAALRLLFGTHPTTEERLGMALAWERGER